MGRISQVLLRPLVSAVCASLLTAILLAPQREVVTVEKVYYQSPSKPHVVREVVVVNQSQCAVDGGAVVRAVNETLNARLGTGDGGVSDDADSGGNVSQSGTARSGAAVAGQVLVTIAACGSATVTANNHVEDVKLQTGDASVNNDAGEVVESVVMSRSMRHRHHRATPPTPSATSSPEPTPISSPPPTPD